MHITLKAARTALHTVVAQAGENHRYESPPHASGRCLNVHNGYPHCLIAKVLVNLGVPVVEHCRVHPHNVSSGIGSLIHAIPDVTIEPNALSYLNYAQSRQDRPHADGQRPRWGQVRDEADNAIRDRGWAL